MAKIADGWAGAIESFSALKFVDANLCGAAQVMLQNNPLTGLLFLAGVAWGAVSAGMPQVAVGALVGLVGATGIATYIGVDDPSLRSGLYGYNGVLIGVALPTFLKPNPLLWAYLVFGAAVSVVVMLAIANLVKTWGISALTSPFVLTTWILLIATHAFTGLRILSLPEPGLAQIPMAASARALDGASAISAVLFGVSQVFLIGNVVTGVIFLGALVVSSIWAAAFALAASMLAVIVALALGADSNAVAPGLFGFNPVLTAIAIGTVFYTPQPRVAVYAIMGTIFTVIVQAALDIAVMPFGIPTLTAPFVLATWLFLLPRRNFAPVRHVVGSGGALHDY
jgi:urea transporter